MRLLNWVGQELVGAVDLELEMPALMVGPSGGHDVHQQRQRLFLDVAPA
jgi:hypothetical protein